MDREALEERIAELEAHVEDREKELDALRFAQDLLYLKDEGFLAIEGDRCYPMEDACPIDL